MNSSVFWDNIAERYAAKPVPDESIYQTKLRKTQSLLTPEKTVLEIGCGTGTTALHHAPFAKHILATDIAPKMIEIGKAKAQKANCNNIEFTVLAVDKLNTLEPRYDVVLAHSVLHLVDDYHATIQHVYDLLPSGGYFVSGSVCLNDGFGWLKWVAPIGQWLKKMPPLTF